MCVHIKSPQRPKSIGAARDELRAVLFTFLVRERPWLGRGRCAGECRVGAGVSGENGEVVRRHDGDTLVEGTGLTEDDDIIAEALVGGRLHRRAGLGRTVLGVGVAKRGQDLGTGHLLAVDSENDVFTLFLHGSLLEI